MADESNELLEYIDNLWKKFNNCRAHFPYIPKEAKWKMEARTAPCYIQQGFDIKFVFTKEISEEEIKRINEVGHWINQNAIIHLCAILESFHVISDTITINFELGGAEQLNITRRLRNCFAHSSGKYKADKSYHCKTLILMKEKLGISIEGCTDWPLSIDTVIQPLFEGCIKYVKEMEKKA